MGIRYRIYAQQFCQELNKTLLIIEQIGKTEKPRKTVDELMNSKVLLDGFSKKDVFLVGYIAGMESPHT